MSQETVLQISFSMPPDSPLRWEYLWQPKCTQLSSPNHYGSEMNLWIWRMDKHGWLVGLEHFFHTLGMPSSQLTFIFFQRGWNHQPEINANSYGLGAGMMKLIVSQWIIPPTIPYVKRSSKMVTWMVSISGSLNVPFWEYKGHHQK